MSAKQNVGIWKSCASWWIEHLTLPSFSLGQVSWAATYLEDCLLCKSHNKSWSPCMWWMRWNVLQQNPETWKRKRIWSKQIYPLDYFILVPRLSFSVPIYMKLEICHTWWQKKTKSSRTVPTSLKVRALAGRKQISATERNWTTIAYVLHTFKLLYWKKSMSVQ